MRIKLVWLVGLTLLAAGLRVYRLDDVPLRGDEAFSVREWAESPRETWSDLAAWEPHPIGTFVAFWGWKSLVGDSEFAMRALPLLINLMGVAVMMALAWHFFHHKNAVWLAGLLWTANPFQIWHAQDVRNYAIWAVLSPLAFWLFLLALKRNHPQDWLIYGLAQIAACYSFLLEPFFLGVQLLILLLFYREKWRSAVQAWFGIGIALIPLGVQLIRLSSADYPGTAIPVDIGVFFRQFLPTLLFGEGELSWIVGLGLWVALLAGLARKSSQTRWILGLWLILPMLLFILFSTQMNIFRPRYVIATTPPLLLSIVWIALRGRFPLPQVITGVLVGVSLISIYAYFYTDPPKAPDWRSTAIFLENRVTDSDFVVLNNTDPAFDYYYSGSAEALPWTEIQEDLTTRYQGIFVQIGDSTFDISRDLQENAQFIPPAIAIFKQYRSYEVDEGEIQHPLDLQVGDVAILRGYSLLGGDEWGLTVLLYWQPLRQTETEMVGFVHVPHPSGVGLLAQDDHAPLMGNANTTVWLVDDLLRDPFYLDLPVGDYTLQIGMYDSATQTRLNIPEHGDTFNFSLQIP